MGEAWGCVLNHPLDLTSALNLLIGSLGSFQGKNYPSRAPILRLQGSLEAFQSSAWPRGIPTSSWCCRWRPQMTHPLGTSEKLSQKMEFSGVVLSSWAQVPIWPMFKYHSSLTHPPTKIYWEPSWFHLHSTELLFVACKQEAKSCKWKQKEFRVRTLRFEAPSALTLDKAALHPQC